MCLCRFAMGSTASDKHWLCSLSDLITALIPSLLCVPTTVPFWILECSSLAAQQGSAAHFSHLSWNVNPLPKTSPVCLYIATAIYKRFECVGFIVLVAALMIKPKAFILSYTSNPLFILRQDITKVLWILVCSVWQASFLSLPEFWDLQACATTPRFICFFNDSPQHSYCSGSTWHIVSAHWNNYMNIQHLRVFPDRQEAFLAPVGLH